MSLEFYLQCFSPAVVAAAATFFADRSKHFTHYPILRRALPLSTARQLLAEYLSNLTLD